MKLNPISAGEYAIVLHNGKLEDETRLLGLTVQAIKRVGPIVEQRAQQFVCNAWLVECSLYPAHVLYVDARALWPLRISSKPGSERVCHDLDLMQFENERAINPKQRWALMMPRAKVSP